MDDSFHIEEGIEKARRFLLSVTEIGLPTATEALDPITPQYLGDLISWTAIGARTSESQTHREMASGLSTPVGFKNGTDGNIETGDQRYQIRRAFPQFSRYQRSRALVDRAHAVAIVTAISCCAAAMATRTTTRSAVALAEKALTNAKFAPNIVVDCSHANSAKDPYVQPLVLADCVHQIRDGNMSIVGLMIEKQYRRRQSADPRRFSKAQIRLLGHRPVHRLVDYGNGHT
jgi:3-deoxy-7-phosphoheptulonate synthase